VQIDVLPVCLPRDRALIAPTQQGTAERPHHSVSDGFNLLTISKFNRAIITGALAKQQLLRAASAFPGGTAGDGLRNLPRDKPFQDEFGCNSHHFQTRFLSGRRALSRFCPSCPLPGSPSEGGLNSCSYQFCLALGHPSFATKYCRVKAQLQQA